MQLHTAMPERRSRSTYRKEDDVERVVFSNEGDKIPAGTIFADNFLRNFTVWTVRDPAVPVEPDWDLRSRNRRTARWACACEEQRSEDKFITLPSKRGAEEGEEDEVSAPRGHTFRGKSRPAKRTPRERKKEIWNGFTQCSRDMLSWGR